MALTEIPVELSSTPGIADSSNATAITIDSSENISIGGLVLVGGVTNTAGGYQLKVGGSDNQGELALFSNSTAADLLSYDRTNSHYNTLNIHASSTIFTQGNVGIGRTPANILDIEFADGSNVTAGNIADNSVTGINMINTTNSNGAGTHIKMMANNGNNMTAIAHEQVATNSAMMLFYTEQAGTFSEKMRINEAGQVFIGRTSGSFGATTGIVFRPNNDSYIIVDDSPALTLRRNNSDGDIQTFYRDGSKIGDITISTTSVSLTSDSDYRLKENVVYDWEALPRLKQLKPARFNFKVDPDSTVDGFLAHEAQTVVPNSIRGTYNETKDVSNVVLDAEGNVLEEEVTEDDWKAGKEAEEGEEPKYAADTTWKAEHTKNIYQGMDHSKLVPLMVKAIQELEAKVKALEEA